MIAKQYSILSQSSDRYDVIIIGAGISGLFLAMELASKCSVLVIEKEGTSPFKYWLTGHDIKYDDVLFSNCIDTEYHKLDFIAYDGTSYSGNGKAKLWDSCALISRLYDKAKENGAVFTFNKKFYSYSITNDRISVFYENLCSSAKLLIDCMGSDSVLISAENCFMPLGYYVLFGGEVELKRELNPVVLHNICLDRQAYMFEIFPTSKKTAHTLLITPIAKYDSKRNVKQIYHNIMNRTFYADFFENLVSSYGGIVPVGIMKRRALDRIFFGGEGAQIQPPASALCLHRILVTYKKVAENLLSCLHNNSLTAGDLSRCVVKPPFTSQLLQLKLFESLLKANPLKFKRIIQNFGFIDERLLEKCLLGEVSFKDILKFKNFIQLIRAM